MAFHNLQSFDGIIVTAEDKTSTQENVAHKLLGGKRSFDATLALLSIILLFPIIVTICAAILIMEGRPIFFRHQRIGRHGRTFGCLKFRTMQNNSLSLLERHLEVDAQARREWTTTRKLKADPRITLLGGALRKSSMDELPQLFNILIGDMSFVGPRPIVRDEVTYYGQGIAAYMSTRPGLTGPWQISGRSDTSYETRVRLDCEYAQNSSFLSDILIILKTVPAVLLSKGSY